MTSFWRLLFSLFLGLATFSLSHADEPPVLDEDTAAEKGADKAVSDTAELWGKGNEKEANTLSLSLARDLSIDDLRGMAQAMLLSAARCGDNSYCISPVSRDDFFVVTKLLDARLLESVPDHQSEGYVQLAALRDTLRQYQNILYGEGKRRLLDGLPPEESFLGELEESLDLPDEPSVIRTAGGSRKNREKGGDGSAPVSEELIEMLTDDPIR